MKAMLKVTLTLFLALVVQNVSAQQMTYSGTVSDETGPLPGVSVLLVGSNSGTETDFDGNFSIQASAGDQIMFSYVGMEDMVVTLGDDSNISVTLKSSNLLDEVVVVGYGTSTKGGFTGSATEVKAEQLEAKNVTNVSQALQGEVAGVTVINTSGQPGTTSTIRIRGFGSVNGNRAPLYVLDGVPYFGSLNAINPADIASTTVLKDATATAIYGSRGANGVILITTKSGKAGQSSIEVDVKQGFNVALLPRYSRISSPEEYIETAWNGVRNRGVAVGAADPDAYAAANLFGGSGSSIVPAYNMWNADAASLIDPATGKVAAGVTRKYDPENWEDYGFQDSKRTEANLSMRGGNEKTRYSTSFGYLNDEGYIINSSFERFGARVNVTSEVKKWYQTTANIGYTYSESRTNGQSSDSGSIFWFVDNLPSIYPLFLRDADGNRVPSRRVGYGDYEYDYGDQGRGFGALTNSIADATFDREGSKAHEFNGNFAQKITFLEGLSYTNHFAANYRMNSFSDVRNKFYGSAAGQLGSIFKSNSETFTYNLQNLLRYDFDLNDTHNFGILLGQESNYWQLRGFQASANRMVVDDVELDEISNFVVVNPSGTYSSLSQESLISYFGQVNYNFDNKYYLSGSVRRDGSSKFVNNKWGTFGSVGASWILSEEDFLADSKAITNLKVSGSYGIVGDQGGVGRYSGYNGFDVSNNNGLALSLRPNANPDLTWETSNQWQTAVDVSLFNFLDVNLTYYNKLTDNLIFDRRDAPSTGNAIFTVNDGELANRGLEYDLNFHLIKKDNFFLDFGVNGQWLRNELVSMPFDPATNGPKVIDIAGSYGRSEGRSLFDFYMREWAGVDPADGRAMWFQYFDDLDGDGMLGSQDVLIENMTQYLYDNPDASVAKTTTKTYSSATQKYIDKSAIPTLQGAFRLNGQVGNFDFGVLFVYQYGGYAYDGAYAGLMDDSSVGSGNWHTDIRNRWMEPGDVTNVPLLSGEYYTNANSLSSRFVTKSDYLGLNNFRVGYTFPRRWMESIGMNSLNLNVSGDNVFLLSARDGFNPSASETGASNTYRYSPLSTFTLGLKAKF